MTMKYLYLFLLLLVFNFLSYGQSAPTNYCTSTPTNNFYADIEEVIFGAINNTTNCTNLNGTQGTGTGTVDYYTSFVNSSVPIPTISPGSVNPISVKIQNFGTNCTPMAFNYCGQGKVWVDFDRDGVFNGTNEMFSLGGVTCPNNGANPLIYNTNIVVPSSISIGYTRMRVTWRMYTNNQSEVTPCGAGATPNGSNWGETEDYIVRLDSKKWDYSMETMLSPDSTSFCGQKPVNISVKIKNTGNQPISGGRVNLFITGVDTSTTNLFYNKTWSQTINVGNSINVEFNPILFPKDELVKMTFVTFFTLDSNKSNDTLIKYVQVYKNPVYTLKSDTVCSDTDNTIIITDKPLSLFHKWSNESTSDTTNYKFESSTYVGIQISRGWKCNVVDSVPVVVKPLPKLIMDRDTILCDGQQTTLNVSMNLPGNVSWVGSGNNTILVNVAGVYNARAIAQNGCTNIDSTSVFVVSPPTQSKILDTICANETATIGLDYIGTEFLYKWLGRTETTPLINPKPSVSSGNENFFVQWWYRGCTSKDTVTLTVNPLPNVTLNSQVPICPYFSSTIVATGAKDYNWRGGLGTSNTITVSPMTTTDYYVTGKDINGCSKEVIYRQFVYPTPNIKVKSNKTKDNICLGDSAIIYVNGGKTYNWSTGSSDSIIKIIPTESFQWTIVGTDGNGCKDTLIYRMSVKPAFNLTFDKTVTGCQGEVKRLSASGAKEYDWGNPTGPTIDSFYDVTLIQSTNYQVTATSSHDCQIVVFIPVTVLKKPVAQISDLTICKGDKGQLEAKGGVKYDWTINNQTFITPNGQYGTFNNVDSITVGVEVSNEVGCKDTAWTTVNVINTDNIEVVFKSPLDSYNCASPKIPITLSATPVGGIWSGGSYINGDKMSSDNLNGIVQVIYTFFEPINNCKVERIKNVNFKCVSSISNINNNYELEIYPTPFYEKLTIKYNSQKNEEVFIHIYDFLGKEIHNIFYRVSIGENIIELSNLPFESGVYYLQFKTSSIDIVEKIFKEK